MGEIRFRWLLVPLFSLAVVFLLFVMRAESSPQNQTGPIVVEVLVAQGDLETGLGNVPVKVRVTDSTGQASESTAQTDERGKAVWTFIVSGDARIQVSIDTSPSFLRDLRDPNLNVFKDGSRITESRGASGEVSALEGNLVKFAFLFEPPSQAAAPAPTTTPSKLEVPGLGRYQIVLPEWLKWVFWVLVAIALIWLIITLVGALFPNYYHTHWPAAYAIAHGHPVFWGLFTFLALVLFIIVVLLALGKI